MIDKVYEYQYNYRGEIIETVIRVTKETEKLLYICEARRGRLNKCCLNTFKENEYFNSSYYDKPSLEEYKQALIKHKQSLINLHSHKIKKLEQEIDLINAVKQEDIKND